MATHDYQYYSRTDAQTLVTVPSGGFATENEIIESIDTISYLLQFLLKKHGYDENLLYMDKEEMIKTLERDENINNLLDE